MRRFKKVSKFSWFSTSSRTQNLPHIPCLRPFWETLALVSADLGPVDFCALRRLAAICLAVAIRIVRAFWLECAGGACGMGVAGAAKRLRLRQIGKFVRSVTAVSRRGNDI